jgi:hypothetical protein
MNENAKNEEFAATITFMIQDGECIKKSNDGKFYQIVNGNVYFNKDVDDMTTEEFEEAQRLVGLHKYRK